MIKQPPFLRSGDKVYLVASARSVDQELIDQTTEILSSKGLKAVIPPGLTARDFQFAGTDQHRAQVLQEALDDREAQAILFMRGGYGTQRILELVDFSSFIKHPKWLVGFSDVTALHSYVNTRHIASIHGPMASTLTTSSPDSVDQTFNVLLGAPADLCFPSFHLDVPGRAEGVLKGGNLSLLQSMIGTKGGFNPEGAILFIEDLDEMLYHLDRMMLHMRRAGLLNGLNGVLVGSFSDMRDTTKKYGFSTDNPFGKTAFDIIKEHVSDSGVPVGFGCPAGHGQINMPLILGAKVILNVDEEGNSLRYK